MEGKLIFDATFLIDLERERRGSRGRERKAHAFLSENVGSENLVSSIAWGEFLEGFELGEADPVARLFTSFFDVQSTDRDIAEVYGRLSRRLRAEGQLIASNDLWIAATAVSSGIPLVSNNGKHFKRVPGLRLVSY